MTSRNPLTRGKKQQALALLKAARFDEARPLLEKVCATDRRDAEAWYLLGTLHEQTGIPGEAERCYRCAAELEPARAELHFALGNVQQAVGHSEQATQSYRRALAIRPGFLEAQGNLGATLESQGRLEEAAQSFERTLALDPARAETHYNLANVLRRLGQYEEAVSHYREAIRLRADFADALVNLGIALIHNASHAAPTSRRAGLLEESVVSLQHAVRLKPGDADVHNNLAVSLRHVGRLDQAAESYRRALAIDPRHEDAHEGLATVELSLGHFGPGWAHYRHRISMRADNTILPPPALPSDLTGKRVLAVHDQGLGDELFFLRFAPWLKKRGAYLMYRPSPKLASILAREHVIDRLVTPDEPATAADYVFSVGDLPWLLGMGDRAQIPAALALAPLPGPLQEVRRRLVGLGAPPYVGVTWRAGTKTKTHVLYKECPLAPLARTLKDTTGTLLVLQRHPAEGEIEAFAQALGRPVHDLSFLNEDLEQMLALLSLIDDYVGVSNTNMHLRAAMGKTARVLVPAPPEWRWMAEGKESPWFPGFTVYRQGYDGSWEEAFDMLGADLHHVYGR